MEKLGSLTESPSDRKEVISEEEGRKLRAGLEGGGPRGPFSGILLAFCKLELLEKLLKMLVHLSLLKNRTTRILCKVAKTQESQLNHYNYC